MERCIGMFQKGKFRRLYLDMTDVELIPDFIVGACVLYAFLVRHESLDGDVENLEDGEVPVPGGNGPERLDGQAVAKRQAIAHLLA